MLRTSPIRRTDRASFVWRISVVLFAGILCLILLWSRPVALPEVLSSELTRRDGLLHRGDQTQPFTGYMLEKYADGGLKSRSAVRGGVLDGVSEGWHVNGQIQVREVFRKGVSHGLRQKWYENGIKLSEGSIIEGKHEGSFRRWHENGTLAEEVTMRQGEPDGLSRAYFPSGFLKTQARLRNGKVIEEQSWKDRELMEARAAREAN